MQCPLDYKSSTISEGRAVSEAPPKRGGGCVSMVSATIALVILAPYLYLSYQDRQRMHETLTTLGVGRWSETCSVEVDVIHQFTGSDSRFYKIRLRPGDAKAF